MNKMIKVQPMGLEDLEQVWEIEKLSFSLPWTLESLRLEIEQNQCARYYIIKANEMAVAYGGMWIVLDEAHITNIAVHPDYRNRRLGRLMVQTLIKEALGIGMGRMTLEVRVSNKAAIRLYKSLGFEEGGIRKGYYANNGEDALIMWNFHLGEGK
ncbi:MAG TPA: ribosomal protein S18-alanine N-acetyltransferase [Bacillota bacterium]|nr:ribosomal protein S18-alanine N-acetyltransferase [Bacillota bacterium]